jgi:hypothetical protein
MELPTSTWSSVLKPGAVEAVTDQALPVVVSSPLAALRIYFIPVASSRNTNTCPHDDVPLVMETVTSVSAPFEMR